MRSKLIVFALFSVLVLTVWSLCVAEESQVAAISEGPAEQWLWGEVVSVKPADKIVTVKYINPQTDQEMNMALGVDDKTRFENASSLDDIRSENSISFTYVTAADGQNIAKSITLENIEEAPASPESPVDPALTLQQQADAPVVSAGPIIEQGQPVVSEQATSNSTDSGQL